MPEPAQEGPWTIYVCPDHGLRHGSIPTASPLNSWCVWCEAHTAQPVEVIPLAPAERLAGAAQNYRFEVLPGGDDEERAAAEELDEALAAYRYANPVAREPHDPPNSAPPKDVQP